MPKTEPHMRIGELARISGKTSRTLHFYEELGLLTPASRTKGGFRLYAPSAVTRVQWIERLQELGFSLQEVSAFLDDLQSRSTGPETMSQLQSFYRDKLGETRAAIQRLRDLERELLGAIQYLDECRGCVAETASSACVHCHQENERALPDMVAAIHDAV